MKKLFLIFSLIYFISININAQWQTEWSSPTISGSFVSGWINFEYSGDKWVNRMYNIDVNTFQIMESVYNTTPKYTYTFTQAEKKRRISYLLLANRFNW